MKKFIKPKLSSKEIDSLLREGYSNLNPSHIIRNVLKVLGISQREYSVFLKKNPNYISDRLSNWNAKRLTISDIYTLKYFIELKYKNLHFNNIIKDILLIEGIESLSPAAIIRRYEMVIKELVEANMFSYNEYEAILSGSDAWIISNKKGK